MPIATSTIKHLTVTPIAGHNFGALASGVDVNDLSEAAFKELEEAVYRHRVVVLKGQKGLLPRSQQAMAIRFDPSTPAELGHMEDVRGIKTLLGDPKSEAKPTLEGGHLININGSGTYDGTKHYGVGREFTLTPLGHRGFHRDELSQEVVDGGHVRFQRWHIDAPFYNHFPAKVTQIWAHTLPSASLGTVDVHWDDGSNQVKTGVQPGATGFLDTQSLYASLSPADQAFADSSVVEYPASPYQHMSGAKADPLGLRMYSEGREVFLTNPASLDGVDQAGQQTLPMVWLNPVTGAKCLQVHAIIASAIHTTDPLTGHTTSLTDLDAVRARLDGLQRPFVTPANVLFAPTEEGDLLLFANRLVRHSAIDHCAPRGDRLLHQIQLVSSDAPFAPGRIPGIPYYKDLEGEGGVAGEVAA